MEVDTSYDAHHGGAEQQRTEWIALLRTFGRQQRVVTEMKRRLVRVAAVDEGIEFRQLFADHGLHGVATQRVEGIGEINFQHCFSSAQVGLEAASGVGGSFCTLLNTETELGWSQLNDHRVTYCTTGGLCDETAQCRANGNWSYTTALLCQCAQRRAIKHRPHCCWDSTS